jgi:Asp-tRNA(Asn)/Glu-tRNA(Gln) amidotransferase A subunit family amidase
MYSYASRYQDNYGKYLAHTRLMIETASLLEGKDYIRAQQIRTRAMNQLRDIFENKKVDLLLTPTTALVAPEIPEGALAYGISNVNNTNRAMEYCSIANLTGVPAVSVPFGYHQGNLPIGLQFIGAWWNEALLLRIAKACERIPGNHRKRPDDHWYSVDVIKK